MDVIQVDRVSKTFRRRRALCDVSFTAVKGECLGLLGRNGAGKTTLLRIIAGLWRTGAGEVRLFGAPVRGVRDLHDRIGVVHQHTSLPEFLSVDEYLCLEADLRGLGPESVREALALGDLEQWRHTRVGCLSGGTQRKILLARALMHRPELLLLDEPTGELDPVVRQEVWRTLGA